MASPSIIEYSKKGHTTSYVAQSLNRQSIGIEIDEEYVEIGKRRLGF